MSAVMIRPVIPYVFRLEPIDIAIFIIGSVLILLSVISVVIEVAREKAETFGNSKKKTVLLFVGVSAALSIIMLCFFGVAATAVQGILFSIILAYSSYEDIKTRECDDYLHLMIVIAALIGADLANLPEMIVSAAFGGTVMLIAHRFAKDKMGGADIKLVAACSFLLGMNRGILGLLVGMMIAVLVNVFKKDRKKGFPMIPYLAAGYLAAFFMQTGG